MRREGNNRHPEENRITEFVRFFCDNFRDSSDGHPENTRSQMRECEESAELN